MVRIFKPTNQGWVKTAEVLNKQQSSKCTCSAHRAGVGWGGGCTLPCRPLSATALCKAWLRFAWLEQQMIDLCIVLPANHSPLTWRLSFTVTLAGWKINKIVAKLLLSDRREQEWLQLCPHMLPQLVKSPFIVFFKPYICWSFIFLYLNFCLFIVVSSQTFCIVFHPDILQILDWLLLLS